MIKRVVAGVLVTLLLAQPALAAPPSAEQKDEFYKTCMGIAQDDALCGCKRDATTELIDSDFMDVVISSMKGKAPPNNLNVAYNDYIARSNAICKPGY